VGQVFSSVAANYDIMNDFMSGGVHRLWKDELIRELKPTPSMHLLDVAGGTGDIAFRFLNSINGHYGGVDGSGLDLEGGGGVTICDINADMLTEGQKRFRSQIAKNPRATNGEEGVSWVVADAMYLPFPADTVDAYTISFGLRNVTDMDAAISEALRVLKPGGRMLIMEFSHVVNPALNAVYQEYSKHVIPALGEVVAGDRPSYQYLIESIRKMPTQDQLAVKMSNAGFRNVSYRNLTFGSVAIHSGFKL